MEAFYENVRSGIRALWVGLTPYARRLLRFAALPYCYLRLVNWEECPVSRWQVLKDFSYLFFVLKLFPDNYSICRLWELPRSEWKYLYGSMYDPYQRANLRKEVQPAEYDILFKDKNICYELCRAAHLPVPTQFGCPEDTAEHHTLVRELLAEDPDRRLILKPMDGKGGSRIRVAYQSEGDILVWSQANGDARPLAQEEFEGVSVAQEYLTQHPDLTAVAGSTNTVRVLTLMTRARESILVWASIRFGVDDSPIDNMSVGGLGAGVDLETGRLSTHAYDFESRKHSRHPNSGVVFEDLCVPMWEDVVALAKRTQDSFPFYRFLGLDIAVTLQGPVLIEINHAPDTASEEVVGPLLKNERVRREFLAYGLPANRLLYSNSERGGLSPEQVHDEDGRAGQRQKGGQEVPFEGKGRGEVV